MGHITGPQETATITMRVVTVAKISGKPDVSGRAGDRVGLVETTQSTWSHKPATPQMISSGTLEKHLKKEIK